MTIETAQNREQDLEMKVPDSINVPAAIGAVVKAAKKWAKANERPTTD